MLRGCFPWLLWSLAFWSTLKLSNAPILEGHSVCGIWGCGPPTNALLACHLGWMVFLAPSMPLAFHFFTQRQRLLNIGFWVSCSAGLTGVFAIGLHEFFTWYPNATDLARSYFLRRWAFAVITLTDFPTIPLFLYGLAGFGWQAYRRRFRGDQSSRHDIAAATVSAVSGEF